MLCAFNPITQKRFFEELPQTARYSCLIRLALLVFLALLLVDIYNDNCCKLQLERWVDALRDYEVLRKELPDDNEVAESLFHAQVALKKSRGEEVDNMKFGGEVEDVSGLEQFRAAISLPGLPSACVF